MNSKMLEELMVRPVRRKELIEKIVHTYPGKKGTILFSAGFERDREPFFQDSSFYYFVGILEPAIIFMQPLDGVPVLYEPCYTVKRSVWLPNKKTKETMEAVGVSEVVLMGKEVSGYSFGPFFTKESVEKVVAQLQKLVSSGQYLFTPLSSIDNECLWVIRQLCQYVPGLEEQLIDISYLIGEIRRKKSMQELEHMYRAIEITAAAQEAAVETIEPGVEEALVQASIDYIFTQGKAVNAFPSIVGSGKNSTVLHYVDNADVMKAGDLVVVDIGASYSHYAADVTRTYPVSGTYSKRQKQVYTMVLEAQAHVADHARPGMYLNNSDYPKRSLHHIAKAFFAEHGVSDYFPHGIGHFVGLDVHDVGDVKKPLQVGDVITIEPGLYFSEENLGIRIEDMYWIVEEGSMCLTDGITKDSTEIEAIMAAAQRDDDEL